MDLTQIRHVDIVENSGTAASACRCMPGSTGFSISVGVATHDDDDFSMKGHGG